MKVSQAAIDEVRAVRLAQEAEQQRRSTDYMPDLTIASALKAQREALAALRAVVAENPTISAMKELSMCAKRYSDMLVHLELERRIRELEGDQ